MKIKEIEIKYFKSIKELSLTLDSLISVVGKNNYGKTAIFEAILVFFRDRRLEDKDIHMHIAQNFPEISVKFNEVEIDDISLLLGNKYDSDYIYENYLDREIEIKLTFSKIDDKFSSRYTLNEERENIRIPSRTIREVLPEIKYVSSIRNPEDTINKKYSNLSQLMDLLIINDKDDDVINLNGNSLTVKDIKRELKKMEETKVKSLSEKLTNKFQNLVGHQSLSIEIKVEKTDIIYSHGTQITDHDITKSHNTEASFNIMSSGTGMQSLMILAILEAYIEYYDDKKIILIIEEPEVYLHPSLQRKMINVIKQISSFNQVFISTHSPIVVSQLSHQDLVCIKKEKGVTMKMDADPSSIINELGIKPADIFQHTKILFVEGIDDKNLIESLINKLAKETKINSDLINSLKIIEVGGIDTLSFFTNAKILDAMNHTHNNHYQFWIMVDSDGYSKQDVQKNIEKNLIGFSNIYNQENLLILDEYAIESYFIDASILCNLFEDLDFNKTNDVCKKYFDLYQNKLLDKKDGHAQFQNRFKPKNFFNNKGRTFYNLTWGFTESEIDTLNDIQSKWSNKNINQYIVDLPIELIEKTKMNEIVENIKFIFEQISINS